MKTPYGTVTRDAYGTVTMHATRDQLSRWARRPGESWPGGILESLRSLGATFARNGDLVAVHHAGAEDLDATEFTAWADDVRAFLPEEVTA